MCGIAGYLDPSASPDALERGVRRMLDRLLHRGPDGGGYWHPATEPFVFGHRRLAIQDLSEAGHQPMRLASDRWVITYNGELYNTDELRRQLPRDVTWRGHSDTEVLLQGFAHWGIRETVKRAAGMFAVAVWDRERRTITLVRDRLGIKPLYYSIQSTRVFWASELKALLGHPSYQATLDATALAPFLRLGYIPAPQSVFADTWKLLPGHLLTIPIDRPQAIQLECYWDASQVAVECLREGTTRTGADDRSLIQETHDRLRHYIDEHTVGDVPVGLFLSSGTDSSLIAALLRRDLGRRTSTFSVGFENSEWDESLRARAIADHLGTDHRTIYMTDRDVLELIPRWPEIYSEPFADSSGLPTWLVSRFAREHVKVALSGDGGDELFAGYRRYQQTTELACRLRRLPNAARRMAAALLQLPSPSLCHRLQTVQDWLLPGISDGLNESRRKAAQLLGATSERALYECLHSVSFNFHREHLSAAVAPSFAHTTAAWQSDWTLLNNMQLWDAQVYLPNDILPKVDLASMSVGLEVRVPLLDHRLFEWAWTLPGHLRFHAGQGKVVLRQILSQYLPHSLTQHPKRGFSAPLGRWLTGPLRDWAEALLSPANLQSTGLFEATKVRATWQDLLAGRAGFARLWPTLVYLAWQQEYVQSSRGADEDSLRHTGSDSLSVGRMSQHGSDVPEPRATGASSYIDSRS